MAVHFSGITLTSPSHSEQYIQRLHPSLSPKLSLNTPFKTSQMDIEIFLTSVLCAPN